MIDRRRKVVKLYRGDYEQRIEEAAQEAVQAAAAEKRQGPRRNGQKSKALKAAMAHDDLVREADDTGVEKVTVWALGYAEAFDLGDLHPPRTDVDEDGRAKHPEDAAQNVNMATYPRALVCASLVEPVEPGKPGYCETIDDYLTAGAKILRDLSPSRLHYLKLETAAWNVNVGDVELPKVSLVSLLMEPSEPDSKPPHEQE